MVVLGELGGGGEVWMGGAKLCVKGSMQHFTCLLENI